MVTSMTDKSLMRYAVRGLDAPQESRVPQPSAPTHMTPQASATMSAEQSAGWNDWAHALIAERLNEVADVLGDECGQIEARLQKQITELQKEIVELKIANAYERGKSAGTILDLPALPKRGCLDA
jgi:hypothetical protein